MFYDNGGRTPPIPQRPVYQQQPQSQAVPTQRPMGLYRPQTGPFAPQRTQNESGPQYPMFQRPTYSQSAAPQQAGNMQQPMYGQQQQFPWMQRRRRRAYGVGGMGGMYGIGGGGERDINGNSLGEWDYQQSQYPSTFTPAALYAR